MTFLSIRGVPENMHSSWVSTGLDKIKASMKCATLCAPVSGNRKWQHLGPCSLPPAVVEMSLYGVQSQPPLARWQIQPLCHK